jgi:branched-chain amino acid transport system permease protein
VEQIYQWLIAGVPIGCVYALVAVGLVLTYKTSGVFNLAFSGQAFLSGAAFYVLVENESWGLFWAFLVSVFVISPLFGLLLDRALFRYMRTASWVVKLVTALGLLVALPEIIKAVFFTDTTGQNPPSVASMLGMEGDPARGGSWPIWRSLGFKPQFGSFDLGGGHFIAADRVVTIIVTLTAVALLGLLFRYTAVGLQMRAVVESPRMVELAGVDADLVSMQAWVLSSVMAGLAGVLLAPLYFVLDPNIYTLLIVAAIAAAAVGGFASIPLTLVGGLIMGIGERALPDLIGTTSTFAQDVRPAFPFLLLFLLLVFWPRLRGLRVVSDPLAGVDPPPPALSTEYKDEGLQRVSKIGLPIFIAGFLLAMLFLVSDEWVNLLSNGFVLAVILLSVTVLTGLGGQISLAQASFAAAGGFTLANAAAELSIPPMWGLLIGGIVAAAAGAVFVGVIDGLPALIGRAIGRPMPKLSGLYLSLATLAAALMAEHVIFQQDAVSHGQFGITVPRPSFAQSDKMFFFVIFGVFAVVALIVIRIRNGTTGRYLAALRGSETAAAAVGVNATAMRITMFALSAGIAGIGGGLLAMQDTTINPISSYPAIFGVLYVVVVVTLGARTVDGAVNAALGLVVFNWLTGTALSLPPGLVVMGFGLGAITYARHPEGIVEFQTRKSVLATIRQRALKARADVMAKEGRLPSAYRPTWKVTLPVIAGPLAYFLYILIRSPIQGHWVTVHSATLLAFIVPSIVFALAWIVLTEARLRRAGGVSMGHLILASGAAGGALMGWLFDANHWVARESLADCVLVGIAAGTAAVAFILLPVHIERIAHGRKWLGSPMTWREGRAPMGFIIVGAFLFYRTTAVNEPTQIGFFNWINKGFPPAGWPVCFICAIFTIVWTQWFGVVQGACNELAIGGESYEPPPEQTNVLRRVEPLVPAPAGGGV